MDFEVRKVRSPQGRKKLSAERAAYFQLMQQGVSNEDACRIVGVNSKTGRRWRNGRGPSGRNKAAPPVRPVVPPSASSQRYLSQDERVYIADLALFMRTDSPCTRVWEALDSLQESNSS
ncbi:hypothetical protein ACIOFZ_13250 [Streptomyces nodosus]|uniref:hypothetical protein n=1 Tax=Streptomyces nodosus TaxID=40318 RepID=UPI0037F5C096